MDHSCRWGILSPNWNFSNAILQSLQDRRGSKKMVFWILYSTEMAILRPNTTAIIKYSDVIFIYLHYSKHTTARLIAMSEYKRSNSAWQEEEASARRKQQVRIWVWGKLVDGKKYGWNPRFLVNKTWFPDVSCRCSPTNKSIDPVVVSWIGRIAFSLGRMARPGMIPCVGWLLPKRRVEVQCTGSN